MHLNHLDLQVPNVQQTAAFFQRYFGFDQVTNPNSPALAILSNAQGFVLALQRLADAPHNDSYRYPDGFHFGFGISSEAELLALHQRLLEGGLAPSPIQRSNRGMLCYLHAPGNLLIELNFRGQSRFAHSAT